MQQDINITYRKINRNFQVTLPQEFRDKFHLEVGATISMEVVDNKLIIEPFIDQKAISLQKLRSIFQEADNVNPIADTEEEILKIIDEERKAVRKLR